MANKTENLGLAISLGSETPDVDFINKNFKILDSAYEQEREARISADVDLAAALKTEAERATDRENSIESALSEKLQSEVTRSTNTDEAIQIALDSEILRATQAEVENSNAVIAEKERAIAVEAELQNIISENKHVWDDKYTKDEIDNKLSELESKIDSIIQKLDGQ